MKIAELEFELSALQLESQVEQLCRVQEAGQIDLRSEIDELRAKVDAKWRDTYDGLNPWQVAKVARHADRPYTLDYIAALFDDFVELHGDRAYADDPAIVGGFARFDGVPVMLIGHQKGRDTKQRSYRNFGMPRPEGYRKAIRLMQMAERFTLPLVTFIDTPGAFPGIDAEERGQSAAIGESIYVMSQLAVPTLSIVIGEGGSGGALAIGVADRVHMLQYATYSVISPEGCASILWKDAAKAELAANALCITAAKLKELQLIDDIVREPTGGAHRDPAKAAEYVERAIRETLATLGALDPAQRLRERQERLRRAGSYESLV